MEKPSYYQQPARMTSARLDFGISRPISQTYQAPQSNGESRTFMSRASSRASLAIRRHGSNASRRPIISAPSEFRRTDTYSEPPQKAFRPLELSIYLPGNELRPLPTFSNGPAPDITVPPMAHIKRPALSRTPTNFSIPRKPVGSIRRVTRVISIHRDTEAASISSSHLARSNSIYQTDVTTLSCSTQDFLDLLDDAEPQPRPPVPLRIRPPLTLPKTIHRNASDQNLRLRAHLEERQEMESRLQDFDTILEELDHVSPKIDYTEEEDATIRSTIEATLRERRAVRSLSATKPLQITQTSSVLPISKYSPQSPSRPPPPYHKKSPSLPISLRSPYPPPAYALPAAPQSAPPQPTNWEWFHADAHGSPSPQMSFSPHSPQHSQHNRHPSNSTVSDCPSLASAWSTPTSSPNGKSHPLYSCQAGFPCRNLISDMDKEVAVVGYGVAF